jgi:predicted Rossmann fold nucleotide-binding protein DprA/Smf involved in DNA uptake
MNHILVLALTSHALDGSPVGRKVWKSMRSVVAGGIQPSDLAKWAQTNLAPKDAEIATDRLARLQEAEELKEELESTGIGLLTEFDDNYPKLWLERLGDQSPALLFTAGNLSLLNEPSVGIVGSRDVDEHGAAFARAIAEEAVGKGFAVASGGARGVDQIAMLGAFESGGNSVGILADSMARTVTKKETAGALESGSVCLVSPFSPSAGFQVGNAMARNKLIYAISQCTVVIAASEGTGGTWAGAVEALDKQLCPVLVRTWSDAPAAHKRLIATGGIGIETRSEFGDRLSDLEGCVAQRSLL